MKGFRFTIPYGWVLGCLTPIWGYVIFESTTGNLAYINFSRGVVNLLFYYLLYGLVYLCINCFRIAMIGTTVVLYGIAVVDYYVLQFRGNPLMLPQDLFAWRTAAAVLPNYRIEVSRSVVLGGVVLFLVVFLLLHIRVEKLSWRRRGIFAGIYLLSGAVWLTAFYKYDVKLPLADIDDDIFWWSVPSSYQNFGYATSTAILLKFMVFEKPEGYSLATVEEVSREISYESRPVSATTPENILVIMNESLADMRVIHDFETNQEFFPFINSLEENTMKGQLFVQVFGGGTSNTEYEVLTGNSMSFLPYVISAYQPYCRENEYGLVSTLNSQGYTTVAMHPEASSNWNRKVVYGYMGFDEFISKSGYHYPDIDMLREYASDRGNYDRLIERYEEKAPGEKFFVFNVTMQNHGGYEGAFDNFQEEIQLTGEWAGYPQTDRYLSLMKESDQAFAYLLDYFSQVEEPTMIVMFGDHQASVETEFYEKLYGKPLEELTAQEADMQYVTPLIIWTNYEMEERAIGQMSANYLGSLILELANLEMSAYNEFLLDTWQDVPVLGKNGYYLADGTYVSWSDKGERPEALQSYQILEYNYVVDYKNRQDALFVIAP
ncbi:MAG: LTA synthase family protein [Lachnospiraceae bacterium]|nr:LTA synthase family protein [Lachnospiraceae bacterium]